MKKFILNTANLVTIKYMASLELQTDQQTAVHCMQPLRGLQDMFWNDSEVMRQREHVSVRSIRLAGPLCCHTVAAVRILANRRAIQALEAAMHDQLQRLHYMSSCFYFRATELIYASTLYKI